MEITTSITWIFMVLIATLWQLFYSTKWHRAHTRAQVRIRALFPSPLKLMLQIVRQHEFGIRISTPHMIMYLVAHATRKPPGPTNLFREEDNHTDKINHTNHVGGDGSNGSASSHTIHNLGKNFSRIVNRRHMPND
jgi:hypothetical protein